MTPSKEDYIKAIHALNGANEVVSNKSLSQELGVSAASVTDMNSRLLSEELIEYIPYQGVKLTEIGHRVARKLVRKHRLWETFLFEKLNYDWVDIHQEADRLEHASSDLLIDRLDEFLGYPQTDPHGGAIPDSDGHIPHKYKIPLLGVKQGESFTVLEIDDEKEILEYVYDRHVLPGRHYQLINIGDLEDPLTLEDDAGKTVAISPKVAHSIFIELDND